MRLGVGLNGAGRIGRALLRMLHDDPRVSVVAINDRAPVGTVAHLLRHDSVHGRFPVPVEPDSGALRIGGTRVPVTHVDQPGAIPWSDGIRVVVEATGSFAQGNGARAHLGGGVERVVVTAVSDAADETIVLGVHDGVPAEDTRIVSTASCTTHAAALPLALADEWFGVVSAQMTTVHCTTGSQTPMDAPREDLRRARSALVSMIPTTTSAARGLAACLPGVGSRVSCLAVRVPTATVSLVELVVQTRDPLPPADEIRARLRDAAADRLDGFLGVSDEPLVSIDFSGDPRSSIVDLPLLAAPGERLLRLIAWYDNEWGYASRVADLLRLWSAR